MCVWCFNNWASVKYEQELLYVEPHDGWQPEVEKVVEVIKYILYT